MWKMALQMTSLLDVYNQGFLIFLSDENISDDVVLGTTWAHMELTMHPNLDSTSTLLGGTDTSLSSFFICPDPDPLCPNLQMAVLNPYQSLRWTSFLLMTGP